MEVSQQQNIEIRKAKANITLLEDFLQKKNVQTEDLNEQLAIKDSLVDAKQQRVADFSKRLNDMTQCPTKAKAESFTKDKETQQVRVALPERQMNEEIKHAPFVPLGRPTSSAVISGVPSVGGGTFSFSFS